MPVKTNPEWPVLTSYDQDHLTRIALPLGGIGTGTVSLGGRGDLRDWELVNRPAKGFVPQYTFFALYAKPSGGEAVTKVLEGPIDEPECGHHYARAMASWGTVLALTGFQYSGVEKCLRFAATETPSKVFWSNGYAWGTFSQKPVKQGVRVALEVFHGKLAVKRLVLTGVGSVDLPRARTVGKALKLTVQRSVG